MITSWSPASFPQPGVVIRELSNLVPGDKATDNDRTKPWSYEIVCFGRRANSRSKSPFSAGKDLDNLV